MKKLLLSLFLLIAISHSIEAITIRHRHDQVLLKSSTVNFSVVTADSFIGDGSMLTGVILGGGVTGMGIINNVAFWESSNTITADSKFVWDRSSSKLIVTGNLLVGTGGIATGAFSSVAGGAGNFAFGTNTFVGGGSFNSAFGDFSFIGGGDDNISIGTHSVVSGGELNRVGENHSFVGGGENNTVDAMNSVIVGGKDNEITPTMSFSFIGGGNSNTIREDNAIIAGGVQNIASGFSSGVFGGTNNIASGNSSFIVGGNNNKATGILSFVGAGSFNLSSGERSVVVGGLNNTATAEDSFVGGGEDNTASGFQSVVVGGLRNTATVEGSFVGSGEDNTASGLMSFIGGGDNNIASRDHAVVVGGENNRAEGANSFIGGGDENVAISSTTTISGGSLNTARGFFSTIGGGLSNKTRGFGSSIGGGNNNIVTGDFSTIPGGIDNIVSGNYSFSVGRLAHAFHDGSVVFGDSSTTTISTTISDSFIVQQSKVGLGTPTPNEQLTVEGALSLDEISAPSLTTGYGKVYVKSSDSDLYFKDSSGTETNLVSGAVSPYPPEYVSGIELEWASSDTITLNIGFVRDSTNVDNLEVTENQLIDITVSGKNGLDTGIAAISTWYAVHVIFDQESFNETAGIFSLSATAPTLPAGYETFRRVGWARNNVTGNILKFYQNGRGHDRDYEYDDASTNLNVFTEASGGGGAATTFTSVDLSSFVPPTSIFVRLRLTYDAKNDENALEIRPNGSIVPELSAIIKTHGVKTRNDYDDKWSNTDSSQMIQYAAEHQDDGVIIDVAGFLDSI